MARKPGGSGSRAPRGAGLYDRGEGFGFLSNELTRREFTGDLTAAESHTLLILNQRAWNKRSLLVRASASFITLQSPLSMRTVQRTLDALVRLGWIHLREQNKKLGNLYLVEPVYIWSGKWHELKSIEWATLPHRQTELEQLRQDGVTAEGAELRQNDATEASYAKLTQQKRQNGVTRGALPRSPLRQNGANRRSDLKEEDGATRYPPKRGAEGGEDAPSQRPPDGGPSDRGLTAAGTSGGGQRAAAPEYKNQVLELFKALQAKAITSEEYERRMEELAAKHDQPTFFKDRKGGKGGDCNRRSSEEARQ